MNKTLMIGVDFQYDFIVGTLAVESARDAVINVESLIDEIPINKIILTADWHNSNHVSFKGYGGKWPEHCVQYTLGATIGGLIVGTISRNKIPYKVITKGTNHSIEQYSFLTGRTKQYKDKLFSSYSTILLTGIAGDYCVLETLRDMKDYWDRVIVVSDCVASIDGGETISKFCKENSIRYITSDNLKYKE